MTPHRLAFAAVLGAVALATGCHTTSTSSRVAYPTQPAVVAASPAPCATPVVAAPTVAAPVAVSPVPPPPPGFVR